MQITETLFSPQVVAPVGIAAGAVNSLVVMLPAIINGLMVIFLLLAVAHKIWLLKKEWNNRNAPRE